MSVGSLSSSHQEGRDAGGVARSSTSPKSRKRGYSLDEIKLAHCKC